MGTELETRLPSDIEVKHFSVATKEVNADGLFTGFAAVYGNVDYKSDVIEKGAFRKTVQERKQKAPILEEHRTLVGSATIEDSDYGLKTFGKFNLDTQAGRDAYSNVKFLHAEGHSMGMSIGFLPVPGKWDRDYKSGIRSIKELNLFEVTLTTAAVNPLAGVTQIKSLDDRIEDHLAIWTEVQAELKSGRKISKAREDRLRAAATEILSLLAEAGADEATTSEGADTKSSEPAIDHSKLTPLIDQMRQYFQNA